VVDVLWFFGGGKVTGRGGFCCVLPCREKEEREERESVLNAWC